MKVVLLGQISNFLPQLGLGWTEEGGSSVINVSQIDDDRQLTYFKRWLSQRYGAGVGRCTITVVSAHRSLREDLCDIIATEAPDVQCDVQFLKNLMPFEDTEPFEKHSSRLLPPLANKARTLYPALYTTSHTNAMMDDETPTSTNVTFRYVPIINDLATTLTLQTSISVGVLPPPTGNQLSLHTFFNRTTTSMGRRRMPHLLSHPLIDPKAIQFRQEFVKTLLVNRSVRLDIQNVCLAKLCDLDTFAYRLVNAIKLSSVARKQLVLKLADMSDTIDIIQSLRKIIDDQRQATLKSVPDLDEWIVNPLQHLGSGVVKLRSLIHHVFDVDALRAAQRDPETLILNPSLVETLGDASREVEDCLMKMERHRAEVERELSGGSSRGGATNKLRLIIMPTLGRVFRAPKSMQVSSKYTLIRVNKSETQFTSAKLKDLNEKLSDSLIKVQSTESAFIDKVLEVSTTYIKTLHRLADVLGLIDILCAFASGLSVLPGSNASWIVPEIVTRDTDTELYVEEGKHVLLELHSGIRGGSELVVPNAVDLRSSSDHSSSSTARKLLLVTGPNMGGKSTYARQAALIALMAQYGALVPARRARLTPFSLIWTRIGADDAPGQGLSTFMTEAIETALMLRTLEPGPSTQATHRALLIIDELGRGTSATDGLKFAEGVTRKIVALPQCLAIFATHFHLLGNLQLPGLAPVCISRTKTLDGESFKIKDGVESDSDGIALAKELGFPESIVEYALQLVQKQGQVQVTN